MAAGEGAPAGQWAGSEARGKRDFGKSAQGEKVPRVPVAPRAAGEPGARRTAKVPTGDSGPSGGDF